MLNSDDEKRLRAKLAEVEAALRHQREHTLAEKKRADRLEQQMRDAWKVAALNRPQRQRPS